MVPQYKNFPSDSLLKKKKKNQHTDKLNIITKPKIKTYIKKMWVVIWDLSLEFFDNKLLVGVEVKPLVFFFFSFEKEKVGCCLGFKFRIS